MPACTPAELWPAFGLRLSSGDLTLTPACDADLCELVDLARSGIHADSFMPFGVPWTLASPEDFPRLFAQFHWSQRTHCRPEHLDLDLTVRKGGVLVGVQGFQLRDFAVTRTAGTGSWLALRHQNQGIGTRMRRIVCTFLIDRLGATQVTSEAFLDNPASLAVSRKLGYRPDGQQRRARLGESAVGQRLVLDAGDFVRGDPVEVAGDEPLRRFLRLH